MNGWDKMNKINRIFVVLRDIYAMCAWENEEWGASTVHGQVYSVTDDGDLPLAGMNTNACEYTSCPIQTSNRQTYAYTLPLAKKFPVVSELRASARARAPHFYDIQKMCLIDIRVYPVLMFLLFRTFFLRQGTYTIRWVLRNPEKPETSSERCCFTTKIKLTK